MPVVTEEQPTPARRRGRYPAEFRRDAAALVIDQKRTVADVALAGRRRADPRQLGAPGAHRPG